MQRIKPDGEWNGVEVVSTISLQKQWAISNQLVRYHILKGHLEKIEIPGARTIYIRVDQAEKVFFRQPKEEL